jgi:hypothetical protein
MLAEELIALSHCRRETPPFTDAYPGLTPAWGSTRLRGLSLPGLTVRFE